jgi:hypothetical protein
MEGGGGGGGGRGGGGGGEMSRDAPGAPGCRGGDVTHLLGGQEPLPAVVEPVLGRLERLGARVRGGVGVVHGLAHGAALRLGGAALRGQALLVQVQRGRVARDGGVHERLREGGLVQLVVAVPAVAHQVDDDVALEVLPVLARQLKHAHHRLGVVRVHVEDGHVERAPDVAAVQRGPPRLGVGGEAHLVVHHHVHGAPRAVVLQLRQQERLVHDALAREGGVAVQQHPQHLVAGRVAREVLLGAHLARHHRVHRLQVAGVGDQGEVHLATVRVGAVVAGAQVVLHVPAAAPVPARQALVVLLRAGGDGGAHTSSSSPPPACDPPAGPRGCPGTRTAAAPWACG